MRAYGVGKKVGCSCCNDVYVCTKYRGRMRKQRKGRVKHRQRVRARRQNRIV